MKRGLRLKFAVLFILVVTVALGAAGLWSALSQQKQAEKEMTVFLRKLDRART